MARARRLKFVVASVAPEDADGPRSVVACRDHVGAAVPDHRRHARIEAVVRQQVGEQVALVLPRAVEFASVHRLEVRVEREVADDPLGVDPRLRGGDEEGQAGLAQAGEGRGDALVRRVLEEADVGEPLAIVSDGALDRLARVGADQCRELGAQRRADG